MEWTTPKKRMLCSVDAQHDKKYCSKVWIIMARCQLTRVLAINSFIFLFNPWLNTLIETLTHNPTLTISLPLSLSLAFSLHKSGLIYTLHTEENCIKIRGMSNLSSIDGAT